MNDVPHRRSPITAPRARCAVVALIAFVAGCQAPPKKPARDAEQVRAQVTRMLPASTAERARWADAFTDAFFALDVDPTASHLCAAVAVTAQESGLVADPPVANLGRIARTEIDRRAAAHHIPQLMVDAALSIASGNGRSYAQRIAGARTERELSAIYEDMIDRVPLGKRLFADANPVRTAGPMQVSIDFAERHARQHRYPYPLADGETIRHEAFTLRGGVYFGVARLLAYPVSYDRMLYRFADYNAGVYASRNAAFQNAVAIASGARLALDGDLVDYDGGPGATERAVRSLAAKLQMDDAEIRAALEAGDRLEFEESPLYARMFALAGQRKGAALPRAMIPQIALSSPKITRKLTTQWFAERVEQRYRSCLKSAGA
jgi:hypothetical protein